MRVSFEGASGNLEGILTIPGHTGRCPTVVVCHPHPLMGGNMDNNVVVGVCESLQANGIASLRFNFRGVGGSAGYHDKGIGEIDDVKCAIEYVKSKQGIDSGNLALSGYSFGASIALKTSTDLNGLMGMSLISLPGTKDNELQNRWPNVPTQLIVGRLDKPDFVSRVVYLEQQHTEIVDTKIVEGSDHFFLGDEDLVGNMVSNFLTSQFNEK